MPLASVPPIRNPNTMRYLALLLICVSVMAAESQWDSDVRDAKDVLSAESSLPDHIRWREVRPISRNGNKRIVLIDVAVPDPSWRQTRGRAIIAFEIDGKILRWSGRGYWPVVGDPKREDLDALQSRIGWEGFNFPLTPLRRDTPRPPRPTATSVHLEFRTQDGGTAIVSVEYTGPRSSAAISAVIREPLLGTVFANEQAAFNSVKKVVADLDLPAVAVGSTYTAKPPDVTIAKGPIAPQVVRIDPHRKDLPGALIITVPANQPFLSKQHETLIQNALIDVIDTRPILDPAVDIPTMMAPRIASATKDLDLDQGLLAVQWHR
jgi:hypothetical protein